MVFSSTIFLFLFLPALLLIYYNPIFKGRVFRNVVLLLSSLFFYAWGEPLFVYVMILSVAVTWAIGLMISRDGEKRKNWLVVGIIFHVLLLFIFKYLSFLADQAGHLFHFENTMHIALPIGLSFFTFQLMSYLFDIYYGDAEAQKNPFFVGLYISLFPQLIAGPIVRYKKIADEITCRRESHVDFVLGTKRFIYGLGKKVLLANYLAQVADNIFDYLNQMSAAIAWLGIICYTLQIYFDFSGYSDMAIGLGQMFGFHFEENFDYPYCSKSVTEYWRRWHISLGSWFKDYVYFPLGGNRVNKLRWLKNLFVVWFLTGAWHGANWTYLCWGIIYFVILVIEKETHFAMNHYHGWKAALARIYTLLTITLAFVVFRSQNLISAWRYLQALFGCGVLSSGYFFDLAIVNYLSATYSVLIASLVGVTPLFKILMQRLNMADMGICKWVEPMWLFLVFIVSVLQIIGSTYNPFIYFNF